MFITIRIVIKNELCPWSVLYAAIGHAVRSELVDSLILLYTNEPYNNANFNYKITIIFPVDVRLHHEFETAAHNIINRLKPSLNMLTGQQADTETPGGLITLQRTQQVFFVA